MHPTARSKPFRATGSGTTRASATASTSTTSTWAAGGKALRQLGLADAATKPLHGDRRHKLFPSGIILIRPSSRAMNTGGKHDHLHSALQPDRRRHQGREGLAAPARRRQEATCRHGWRDEAVLHGDGRVRLCRNLRGAGRRRHGPLRAAAWGPRLRAHEDAQGVPGDRLPRNHPLARLSRVGCSQPCAGPARATATSSSGSSNWGGIALRANCKCTALCAHQVGPSMLSMVPRTRTVSYAIAALPDRIIVRAPRTIPASASIVILWLVFISSSN